MNPDTEYNQDVKIGIREIREFLPYNLYRFLRLGLIIFITFLALSGLIRFSGWAYTNWVLDHARANGIYPTIEEAIDQFVANKYRDIKQADVSYAGPNSPDGSNPYVWYVILEVRASQYFDGTAVGHNGCDNPGMFFVQTTDGWVHVSEGAMHFGGLAHWMTVFGLAGPGQVTPWIDRVGSQPGRFCQSP